MIAFLRNAQRVEPFTTRELSGARRSAAALAHAFAIDCAGHF
jgi:hypothetical protein